MNLPKIVTEVVMPKPPPFPTDADELLSHITQQVGKKYVGIGRPINQDQELFRHIKEETIHHLALANEIYHFDTPAPASQFWQVEIKRKDNALDVCIEPVSLLQRDVELIQACEVHSWIPKDVWKASIELREYGPLFALGMTRLHAVVGLAKLMYVRNRRLYG